MARRAGQAATVLSAPQIVVVSGLPASGKTWLATRLAAELLLPLVTKDDYKQTLHDHLPALTRAQAGPLSFALMWQVAGVILTAGGSLIAESHFYRPLSEDHLRALAEEHRARVVQVYCHAPLPELRRRHAARVTAGTRPHIDQPFEHTELPPEACWAPLALPGPLLRLDTTQPDAATQGAEWVRAQLQAGSRD